MPVPQLQKPSQRSSKASYVGLGASLWLLCQSFLWIPLVVAQTIPAGTTIDNQATGSFVDTATGNTTNIESNIVSVTVAEVTGINITPISLVNSPSVGQTVNFDFTITNVGNDPTQFFIPAAPSSITGGTAGTLQIIAYDPDGASGAGASIDLSANNITVASGGRSTGGTGGLLTSLASANNGSIPAGGTLTVRVPVTVTAAPGQSVSVTLGNADGRGSSSTLSSTQNLDYQASTADLYTVDNLDNTTGETNGAPINGTKEASATQSTTVAATTNLTVTKTTSTPTITAGDAVTYTITVFNSTANTVTNLAITDYLPSGFSFDTTSSVTLTGSATRPTTSNPTQGTVVPTWGSFTLPAGGQVRIIFTTTTDYSTEARLHQNPLRITYTDSASQSQTLSYDPTTSTSEDVTVSLPSPTALTSSLLAPTGNTCSAATRTNATPSGVINTYYLGSSVSADKKTITVGTATGASATIKKDDLLLIIQMQDATVDTNNDARYGSGTANNRGSGVTNLNNAGVYEYAIAAADASGSTITVTSALVNTYTNSNATSSEGQKRFQVVRVPQYQNASVSSAITPLPWNGSTGGIVALDVAGTLTFSGNGKIVASGAGFRGGGGRNTTGSGTAPAGGLRDYVRLTSTNLHGSKAESIAGTPRYTRQIVTIDTSGTVTAGTSVTDNTTEGYPNGSMGRGAPGNGGGGGTDPQTTNAANTGGGGGSNYGAGGRGGDSWYDGYGRQPRGGLGGFALPTSVNRIFMGGGGGAGSSNNSSTSLPSGGNGGGIILVRAGAISGTGSIEANGLIGVTANGTDSGGAGGAGGSILINAVNVSSASLSLSAAGGNGSNSNYWSHGPGGGGGGGYIAYQGISPTATNVTGGSPGNDLSGSTNPYLPNVAPDPDPNSSPDPYGAKSGSAGIAAVVAIPTAGVSFGANCSGNPGVLLVKRITSINGSTTAIGGDNLTGYTQQDANPYDDNVVESTLAPNLPAYPIADTDKWPNTTAKTSSTFLIGGINGGQTRPGDEVEYTIYFLSSGSVAASNVKFCDRIPNKQTFVPNGYNSVTAAGGGNGSDRGIAVSYNGSYASYTNTSDGDTAQYYERGVVPLPAVCGGDLNSNPTGAIVVNLGQGATSSTGGTLPNATTTPNTNTATYGFVRVKAKVD